MRRALLALGLLLVCITQALALAGQQRTVMMQPPGWVLQGQPVSMDWAHGRYWAPGMGYTGPLVLTTTTRASTKYCQMLSGIWQTSNNNNYPSICDQGILIEEARTNDALWSRDMTRAGSWTLVGDTVALNAVGIDGQANSASTLTATGTASSCTASCTALQSITLGSSADTYSVWLKRVTGSGAVNITINNLTGTTACTLVTTAFTRCSVTATLANPIIGIQMTAVGDVIVADFNQMEPGGFVTSPILTTSATATRAADAITGTVALLLGGNVISGSVFLSLIAPPAKFTMFVEGVGITGFSLGTNGPGTFLNNTLRAGASNRGDFNNGDVTLTPGAAVNTAVSYGPAPISSGNGTTMAQTSTPTENDFGSVINIGVRNGSPLTNIDGYIKQLAFFQNALSQARLNLLTK